MSSSLPDNYFKYGFWAGLGLGLLVEYPALNVVYQTLGRDLRQIGLYVKVLSESAVLRHNNITVADVFKETCKKFPNKPMIVYADTGEEWTFEDVDNYSNKIAHYFNHIGFTKGDVIAVFMGNTPKYVPIVLGLSKIGVIPALINNNLMQEPLLHCIQICKSKACIFEDNLGQRVLDILPALDHLSKNFHLFQVGSMSIEHPRSINLDVDLTTFPTCPVSNEIRSHLSNKDDFVFIFTSGTTGLPKAAHGDHVKFSEPGAILKNTARLSPDDRLYSCLPLYHSSAQWMALGPAIQVGCTYIMRSKFSATQFWSDCVKYKATAAQYIGEMCRFLLATPEHPDEVKHNLRFIYGVGLNQEHMWKEFVQRFNIPSVIEIYGSTDGNMGGLNVNGKPGAIGSLSRIFPFIPFGLIKVDEETGDPIRDPRTGLCVPCKTGEIGEMVGKIRPGDRGGPKNFQVYLNKKSETEKKIIRGVWRPNDVCFRSGDTMVMDEHGWLFFKDRTGDTFRWRGENVSTSEVESILVQILGHSKVAVFGVGIPHVEGKAGMAVIEDPERKTDLQQLAERIQQKLPKYAQPMFLRLTDHLEMTGTYKKIKRNLQRQGYNITTTNDPIFFKGPKDTEYKQLDLEILEDIGKNFRAAKL